MKNEYEVSGKITVIFIRLKSGEELEVVIDTNDLLRTKEIKNSLRAQWDYDINAYYIIFNATIDGKYKKILFHRWLMGNPQGMVIDHKNHNTLDNRRSENLRIVTNAENQQNRNRSNSNNSTGIRGVYKHGKRFKAMVRINKEQITIGHFENIDDATEAVERKRKEMMPYSQEALA